MSRNSRAAAALVPSVDDGAVVAGDGGECGGGDGGAGVRATDDGAAVTAAPWWWGPATAVSLAMVKLKLPLPAGCRFVSVTHQLTVQVPFGAGAGGLGLDRHLTGEQQRLDPATAPRGIAAGHGDLRAGPDGLGERDAD